MPTDILMPALSPTMEEGKLAKWLVKEGDEVSSGDIIAEIETDKATMEVEAVDEGTVAAIKVAEGTEGVKVNTVIAVLAADGEDASSAASGDSGSKSDGEQSSSGTDVAGGGEAIVKPADAITGAAVTAPEPMIAPALSASASSAADPEIPEGTEMVEMTVREALNSAMAEEMRSDPDVFLMGEEVAEYQGAYKISQGLLEEFGAKRVIDTPITEHGFTGIAVGAAFAGLKPIVEFMTFNFAMQAIDHIINSAAKTLYMSGGQMGCPIVFRGANGAAARVAAQHSQDYASWYAHVPGLKVVMPYSAADAKGLLKAAIRDPNPVIFLENEILYGKTFEVPKLDDWVVPIGKAKVARPGQGRDHRVMGHRHGLCAGCGRRAGQGRSRGGGDRPALASPVRPAHGHRKREENQSLRVVEEAWPVASMGSHIAAEIMTHAFDYLDAPVARVNGKDVPMPYAANLEKLALPNVDEVVEAAKAVLYA
jgi:pyruvate dehydrogenase E1 component beta subunit